MECSLGFQAVRGSPSHNAFSLPDTKTGKSDLFVAIRPFILAKEIIEIHDLTGYSAFYVMLWTSMFSLGD